MAPPIEVWLYCTLFSRVVCRSAIDIGPPKHLDPTFKRGRLIPIPNKRCSSWVSSCPAKIAYAREFLIQLENNKTSQSVQYLSPAYILNHGVMIIGPLVRYKSRVVQHMYGKKIIGLHHGKCFNNKSGK